MTLSPVAPQSLHNAVTMRNSQYKTSFDGANALWFALCLALSTAANAGTPDAQAPAKALAFEWKSSEPLVKPPAARKDIFGVTDPTIVYHDGR